MPHPSWFCNGSTLLFAFQEPSRSVFFGETSPPFLTLCVQVCAQHPRMLAPSKGIFEFPIGSVYTTTTSYKLDTPYLLTCSPFFLDRPDRRTSLKHIPQSYKHEKRENTAVDIIFYRLNTN